MLYQFNLFRKISIQSKYIFDMNVPATIILYVLSFMTYLSLIHSLGE